MSTADGFGVWTVGTGDPWAVVQRSEDLGGGGFVGWLDAERMLFLVERPPTALLRVIATDGTVLSERPLPETPAGLQVHLSPAGNLLAVASFGEESGTRPGVAVYDTESLKLQRRIDDAQLLAWSPDSRQLAVSSAACTPDERLVILDLAAGRTTELTELANTASWSPDSRWISFQLDGALYLAGLGGTGGPRLVSDNGLTFAPGAWSSSSRFVGMVGNVLGHARCE